MRGEQFDRIMTTLNSLDRRFSILTEQFCLMRRNISALEQKTLVVSEIDKEMEQMKIDIKSIKDEIGA